MVDMGNFIVAKSDQLNSDDLMTGPRTITITKVTAAPDAAEQPVSIHYEGGEGRPWKPCKTMRRVLVAMWGRDASHYAGRSLTLYRDPTVAFGGLQVGGIRISHMSDIDGDQTVALLVTRGRKAPFKIKPLLNAPRRADFTAVLEDLRNVARPGNLDELGQKWAEIGPEARKALAGELEALKAACAMPVAEEAQQEDVPFDAQPDPPAEPAVVAEEVSEEEIRKPAMVRADQLIGEIKAAQAQLDVVSIVARAENDLVAMPADLREAVEGAANQRKEEIRKAQTGQLV